MPAASADDVLGCRAHFVADEIGAVVKADQRAGKYVGHLPGEQRIIAVDHHAIGHPAQELLYVAGADPDAEAYLIRQFFPHNLGEPFAGFDFQPFHAEQEAFPGEALRGQLPAQTAQFLRADGDEADAVPRQSLQPIASVRRTSQAVCKYPFCRVLAQPPQRC